MKIGIKSFLLISTLAGALTLFAQQRVPNRGQTPPPKEQLHEIAKQRGGRLVLRYRPSGNRTFSDLADLGRNSDAVIIGRTLGHRPHLTPSGNMITNDYLVKVVEVIKGDIQNGRSITVKIPGGAYKFPDGTYAAIVADGYREPDDRVIYAFFLKARPNSNDYRLVSESQGAFALKREGVESADTDATHPVVTNYRGLSPVEFLRQLHKSVPLQKRNPPARNLAR